MSQSEGAVALIAAAWPRSGALLRDNGALARALAFSVVGLPVLVGLGRWTRRRLCNDPDESASAGWEAFLLLALSVSLVVAMGRWFNVMRWSFRAGDLDGGAVGRALSWTAAWPGCGGWRRVAPGRAAGRHGPSWPAR